MKIAVVGAGISGLTCAFRLQSAGHEVIVLEREAEVGGRMATIVEPGGLSIDVGANLLLENFELTRALVRELGRESEWRELVALGSGGILRDDTLASFSPRGALDVLHFRGLGLRARIRLLAFLERTTRSRGDLDFFDLSIGDDAREDVDADSFMRAHYGDELVDWLVDPFVRTFHFHGARRLSMRYFDALAGLLVGEGGFVPCGLRGGMASLPATLASALSVRRGVGARSISAVDGALRVELDAGSETVDAVVVATTASVAASLLTAFPAPRDLARAVEYSSTMMCAYRVPRSIAQDFEGIWVPRQESALVCCCANETCKGAFDAHDSAFVIGLHDEAARELTQVPDEEVLRVVAAEWSRLFPSHAGSMRGVAVKRWSEALPVYAPTSVGRVRRFWQDGQGRDGVWLCGDYMNHPWIEGSIRCAEKIATRIGR